MEREDTSLTGKIIRYDDFRVEIVFKYRQEMEKVTGLFDVVNEKDAEPTTEIYTQGYTRSLTDALPVSGVHHGRWFGSVGA